MTLRFSSSDSYASNRDNLSLRWTVASALTAFLKTTYNKVAGQFLYELLVAQAQTAIQFLRRTIPASIDITPQMQKSHLPFLFLNYCKWHICTCSNSRTKTLKVTSIIIFILSPFLSFSQDVIQLKSGKELKVKIVKVSESEIEYKKMDNPDGPLYAVSKEDVSYFNFYKETPPSNKSGNVSKPNTPYQDSLLALLGEIEEQQEIVQQQIKQISDNVSTISTRLATDSLEEKTWIPKVFGFGVNVAQVLQTGKEAPINSFLLPLTFHKNFRTELELAFYSPDTSEQQITFAIPLYGMWQIGKVNYYAGLNFISWGYRKEIKIKQDSIVIKKEMMLAAISPTLGAEYSIGKHFSIGAEIGFPLATDKKNVSAMVVARNRIILRFYIGGNVKTSNSNKEFHTMQFKNTE